MRFIISLLINGLLVLLISRYMDTVSVDNYTTAILVGAVLAIVNFLVRPILKILTFPITILTLGLFLLVINGLMVLLVDNLIQGFEVDGLVSAIIFSIALAILNTIAGWLGLSGTKD